MSCGSIGRRLANLRTALWFVLFSNSGVDVVFYPQGKQTSNGLFRVGSIAFIMADGLKGRVVVSLATMDGVV